MKDVSDVEARGESSSQRDKKGFGKEQSVALSSLHSGSTQKQHPESGPSKRTQNESHEVERIDLDVDRMDFQQFQTYFPRIFELVSSGDHEALSDLLTNSTTEVYSINSKGNTALHHAVESACNRGHTEDRFYQCIDLLMNCQKMKVNLLNKNGYTAIGLAVEKRDRKCVEHMLRHPSFDRLYLDYFPGDRESTVREIIMETYPELQPLLPGPIMKSLDSSDRDMKLLAALQRDEYNIFENIIRDLTNLNPAPWYDEPYHLSLLEIACQMKNRKRFVELLLENRAEPNIKNSVTGMPLIHATARSGNFEVLKVLLEKQEIDTSVKDNEKRTILHWLAGVSEGKPGDKQNIEKCFSLLLESNFIRRKDIDDRDSSGKTALYITVERGFRERAKVLLSKGADVRVFERDSKVLLSDSLSVVREFLDDCLQHNNKPLTSKDFQLKLNYQSLMNIVPPIAESGKHSDLLTHPVMSAFLTIKWENVRIIYFLYLTLYFIFLCSLTAYILCSEAYSTLNDRGAARNTTDTFSVKDSNITSGLFDNNFISQLHNNGLFFLWLPVMILFFLLILIEILQLSVHRWIYLQSLENWLEILLIIFTFILCSGAVQNAMLKLHFSAVVLLLGWSELLLMSGRLPLLSVQQEMLRTVSWTFLKFMAGYVTLLIAFALSFYVLFKGRSEKSSAQMFANPFVSLLKTIIMFTGEFEDSNLSFDTTPYTSHVIFLLFVVLVAIVLLNLLNGLAVNDTRVIKRGAERLSLAATAKLISRIEGIVNELPDCMKPSVELKEEMFVIYPNRRKRIGSATVRSLIYIVIKKREPNEKDKPAGFQDDWSFLKEILSDLQIIQEKLQKKIDSMLYELREIPL